jgi:hypothetical protein
VNPKNPDDLTIEQLDKLAAALTEPEKVRPLPAPPVNLSPSFGVLGKSGCMFCRRWRDRVVLGGAVLVAALIGWEMRGYFLDGE